MPTFLIKDDFKTITTTAIIDKLTGGDDSIIETLVETAVDEMKGYLTSRYNLIAIFDSGESCPVLNMYCKDIALYHLFSRSNQNQIPLIRETRYKAALKWLDDVQNQKINPPELPLLNDAEKALVKAGGNTKRNNHQE